MSINMEEIMCKFKKTILIILLNILIVFSITPVFSAQTCESPKISNANTIKNSGDQIISGTISQTNNKFSEELYQIMETADENEKIPVFIWKNDIPQNLINNNLLKKGYVAQNFEHDKLFLELETNKIGAQKNNEIIRQKQENFKTAKLTAIREVTEHENIEFLKRHNIQNNKIFYLSKYTSTIAMELTKKEILTISKDKDVSDFSVYKEPQYTNDTCVAVDQIGSGMGTTNLPGLKSNAMGGLTGKGVKIGIMEYAGRYNPDNPQLKELHDSGQLCYVGNSKDAPITSHADLVTSIICGQKKRYLFNPYLEGIATDAQVYFCAINTKLSQDDQYMSFLTAFEWFAFLGVDVINMSAGIFDNNKYAERGSYRDFDREADRLINQTNIILVKSAGNDDNLRISSPGLAYNAITVGNAITKSGKYDSLTAPYNISPSSSYIVDSHLSNKPEVCAPGTNISAKTSGITVTTSTGTSFAAPFVTGQIAQLIEKYGTYVNKQYYPQFFKALVMLGSLSNQITDKEFRAGDGYCFSNKGGAGLINGSRCVGSNIGYQNFVITLPNNNSVVNAQTISNNSSEAKIIRAILVYSKTEYTSLMYQGYATNYDLYAEANGNIISKSESLYNNFELMEFVLEPYTTVSLNTVLMSYDDSSFRNSLSLLWMVSPRGW